METNSLVPSLPVDWYYTESQFLAEKEAIFKKEWVFLCHAKQIPEINDYITCDVMGMPLIVLRGEQNQIQVLLNICRHRAAPLLTEKKGKLAKPILMCQYHGFCYHTDGRFKQAPFVTKPDASLDLIKVNYTEARGMIFVSFNPNPISFDSRKHDILQEMDNAQFKMDDYRFNRQIIREGNFNWKVWIEGYQECYHCPTIHPLFNKDFHLGQYKVINKNHYSVHQCPRKEKSTTGSFEGLWLWMYPNCGMPCYEKVYYSMRINPKSPQKTELIYTFFTNDLLLPAEEEPFFDFVKQITDEDILICERVQQNLEAGSTFFDHGYLNAARENGVHYFHDLIRKALNQNVENITIMEEVAV